MKKTFQKKGAKNWKDDKKKGGYAGGKKFGDQGRGPSGSWQRDGERADRPMMHSATCSQCHATCEVPFKPNGKKPIYCRDCFRAVEKPAYRSSSNSTNSTGALRTGSDDVAKQLKELNAKMDKILDALMSIAE